MSKSTDTNGLDIRFKISNKEYRLRSLAYDFILEEIKIGQSGKSEGKETFSTIGNGSTLDQIFHYLYREHHLRNSVLTEVVDLVEELNKVIKSIQEVTRNITIECFILPEDRKNLVNKLQLAEDEIERLRSENKSLKKKKS